MAYGEPYNPDGYQTYADWQAEQNGGGSSASQPGMGSYLQSLMAAGVISPDRVFPGTEGPSPTYIGNDGFLYKPSYYTPMDAQGNFTGQNYLGHVERIDAKNVLSSPNARGSWDVKDSKSDLLHPDTGAVVGSGTADWDHRPIGELAAMAFIAATAAAAGGAALGGGGAGGGAGATGATTGGGGSLSNLGSFGSMFDGTAAGAGGGFGGSSVGGLGGFAAGADAAVANAAAAYGGAVGGAGMGYETASEGFGPQFEQSVANNSWQMPSYPPDYGQMPPVDVQGVPPPANPNVTPGSSGVPPPANPNISGGGASSMLDSLIPGAGGLLGPLATAAGGLLGAQGQDQSASTTKQLPSYLQGPVADDLIPRIQGQLAGQMQPAITLGSQMAGQGSQMMSAPVVGNGFGQVKLNAPTTNTNPYLSGMADDIGRRTQDLLGANNRQIQGNFVASGGLGGSRQGIAQGTAAGKAADSLQGNLANLYGTQYSNDQNRALTQYGLDQNFFGQQRGQDISQTAAGAGMVGQGLATQWGPIQQAATAYAPFSGFGSTTQSAQSGGGATGLLGGALGAAQLAKNAGWW